MQVKADNTKQIKFLKGHIRLTKITLKNDYVPANQVQATKDYLERMEQQLAKLEGYSDGDNN